MRTLSSITTLTVDNWAFESLVRPLARQLNILKPAQLWCSVHPVGCNFRINCCTYQTVTNHCVCVDIEVCTAQFVHLERYLRETLEQFCNGLGCQKNSPIRKSTAIQINCSFFTNFKELPKYSSKLINCSVVLKWATTLTLRGVSMGQAVCGEGRMEQCLWKRAVIG